MKFNNYQEFMNALNEQKELEGGSGSSAVAFCHLNFGYPVYAGGLEESERFHVAPPGKAGTAEREVAKAKAQEIAEQYGLDPNRVQFSLQLLIEAQGAVKMQEGEAVLAGWNGNISETAPFWTMNSDAPSALKDLHLEAMQKFNLMHGWSGWAKIGYARDPYKVSLGEAGKTDEGLDGEERFPIVRYITKVYSSKEEAYADIGFGAGSVPGFGGAGVPAGYSPEAWDNVKPQIIQALKTQSPAEVAKTYGVQVGDVTPLM